ncbi:hypothetical protein B7463_g5475, partial [Scytalidium lignicola]
MSSNNQSQSSSNDVQPWQKVWSGDTDPTPGQFESIARKTQPGSQRPSASSIPLEAARKRTEPDISALGVKSEYTVVYNGETRTGPEPKDR